MCIRNSSLCLSSPLHVINEGRNVVIAAFEALIPSSLASSMGGEAETSVSSMLAELKSVEFTYEELSAATSDFSMLYKIGQGGYASVYYGVIRNQVLTFCPLVILVYCACFSRNCN